MTEGVSSYGMISLQIAGRQAGRQLGRWFNASLNTLRMIRCHLRSNLKKLMGPRVSSGAWWRILFPRAYSLAGLPFPELHGRCPVPQSDVWMWAILRGKLHERMALPIDPFSRMTGNAAQWQPLDRRRLGLSCLLACLLACLPPR